MISRIKVLTWTTPGEIQFLPLSLCSSSAPLEIVLFFPFLLPLIHLPFLCLMCRPACYAVCAPLVLCHCWRMQPSKVASLFLPLLGSTPEACGCLPRAFDSFIMWLGCSFSTSPLLMGIWAISRPLLLLVLQWIIMYIYHPMFLPVWYPWGLIFMRETDGLKSKYICNFGRYCQIPPPPFTGLSCLCSQQ